ncbi:MAG TPA: UvrD-helicase domain-containing protein [Acidimicrobiia bacterium]|nr:UvrD-helicase domain-containing protein [Acidimicrobiia bacterium]
MLAGLAPDVYRVVLERVHRVALEAEHPPVTLPLAWNEYWQDNLIAFFACPRDEGALRWIAEIHPRGSCDVCFWRITSSSHQTDLAQFSSDYSALDRTVEEWNDAVESARQRFAELPAPPASASVQNVLDLDAVTFGAVTGHRSYSRWLPELTTHQREFVESATDLSIKLRGPAGSGKTLALELKALRELYGAREAGLSTRILFATHSWATAEQVDQGIRRLDESGDVSPIEVYPLLSIAQDKLPAERSGHGFDILGEDSLSGKKLQLERIDNVLTSAKRGEWLSYRSRVSSQLRERVESDPGSRAFNAFVWDLMIEFSCVLSANGILPSINAEAQYRHVQRTPWMMPLETDADRAFVLSIYSNYVSALRGEGLLTSDQLINDFLNYLETFTWNIRREHEGYDLVFVDELHLFNEQERLVLHYLTRDPDVYPRMFMALDPRQSPAEMYVDVDRAAITRGESGMADAFLGTIRSMELSTVHRFTPQILHLVRHVNDTYPALGLGEEWELDLSAVESSAPSGETPRLVRHATRALEAEGVLARAVDLARGATGDARVAVVVLEPSCLEQLITAAGNARLGNVSVIQGRDDIEALRYTRRSTVLAAAEYVGGLQFDSVLVAGLPDTHTGVAHLGHVRRRFLSLLYLAISRASRYVEIHVNDADGGVPDILESAISNGALTELV